MQNILYLVKKYIKDTILFGLIIICLGFSIYNIYLSYTTEENDLNEITIIDETEEKTVENKKINIDIKGAVKNPGVYEVEEDTIINEVITLAGGFNSNAYKNGINLSKKVSDEMVIYVYTKTEIKEQEANKIENITISTETCSTPDYSICECVEEKESIIETKPNVSDSSNNEIEEETKTVNINTALKEELTTLSGIGESKAEAIISYRKENGSFTNIRDIMNVSGIGEALFAKIKDYITI